MRHVIKNNTPSAYRLKFFEPYNVIKIFDSDGLLYYYRHLPNVIANGVKQPTQEMRVNIPDEGIYYTDFNGTIDRRLLKICPEIYSVRMPPYERDRKGEYVIKHDDSEVRSPAIIYTLQNPALIITGRKFKTLPKPMRVFILLHEKWHQLYRTEKYCDLGAFVDFVKMGYNPSTAIYCLTDELRHNVQNDERIRYLYNVCVRSEIIK